MVYEYRRKTKDNSQAKVPWLQLKGHWLDQAGFSIDTSVTVRVMEGCLVLTTKNE
jgi:toxic protein SymE